MPSRNSNGFNRNILWHSDIYGAADEAVLNKVQKIYNCANIFALARTIVGLFGKL